MKRNGKLQNALRGYRQGGIGMKKLIALLLALVMALAMLGAAAEGLDEELILGESTQANDEAITIGDEVADEGGEDLALAGDAILDGDGLVVDEMSLDGLEDNLLTDGLPELETVAEAPANDLAGNESNPEDFEIDENGVLVKYVGAGGDVVIPDGVTSIGDGAFDGCDSLTSVTIPDSVTSIGDRAFSWCSSLTSVTIPGSVTSIGISAFEWCDSLTSVTIPNSVTSIGDGAFYDCDSLTSVTIGAGVSIDDLIGSDLLDHEATVGFEVTENNETYASKDGVLYTYDMHTLLRCPIPKTSVTIPDSVTSIGDRAFSWCRSLTSVTIPDSVTSIGDRAFSWCESLTSVTIPNSVTSIGDGAFYDCSSLRSVTIPDSVTSIGEDAFSECDSLTSVTIPDGVTSIGEHAFYHCYSLTSVTIGAGVSIDDLIGSNLLDSGATVGFEVTENNDAYASKDGVLYTYDMHTLLRCPIPKRSVTIPDSVTSIGKYAFYSCDSLTSVKIPNGVTSIGDGAFSDCTKLRDVYIPSSVERIGNVAFHQYRWVDWEDDDDDWEDDDDDWEDDDDDWEDGGWIYDNLDLTIHGYVGSYAETYAKKNGFAFEPIVDRISLAKAKLTVKAQVYTGKALKPAVKVVLKGKTLKKGTDYTVTYKNNKAIGTATVTVKGKGNYKGSAKTTFKINPKAVKGLNLVSGQKLLFVGWQKSVGASGYQLQYGVKKSFSGAKKVTIAKASTKTRVLKKLKSGKTYYVRIRAWKKVGGKTYWSAWSAAKKAKVR